MNIEGSIVLVTGANRGIGRSLVKALLARGVRRVYAGARNLRSLDTLAKESGERLIGLELDVTKPGEVAAAASRASDVTLLFNNAGVIGSQNLLASERPSLELDFATNFYGIAVDTDMIRGFEMPKTSPDVAASAILDGVAKGDEDIYPDPMSRDLAAKYQLDPKSLERVFDSM